jgi:ribonuclease E
MSKTMLVNVTHVEESRVAILEDGVLAQYEIETLNRANIKGNIYNAVVENVHPALEAAFLKISSDLKGFLPLDEVNFKLLPSRGESRGRGRIGQHLHNGQKLMVQVIREPFAGKPPTVSTYFSLPGRFLVLMPGVDSAGVSRKIEDSAQRDKLKKLVEELNAPEGFGVIVRTAGLGQTKTELQRDLRYLLRLWESIQRASRAAEFPGPVYRERDLVIRTIRDYLTSDIDEVWVDSAEVYEQALEFMRDVMPTRAKILKLYSGDRPLFSKFNLEEQIESIYKRRVPLKSGGEIVIDGTEALTAIDVNSARSSRQGDAEENAAQTNLEAASEIARQLRLRDLGGLVVVDFIDMAAARNQKKVEKAMRDALKGDKARWDVTRISKLGLLEISRQRIKGEKMRASYATCPVCEGHGLIKNVEAAALSALRKLQARCARGDFGRIRMGVPPEVAVWILNNKREDLHQLERRNAVRIVVEPKASLMRHESEFETFAREKGEEPPALVAPDRTPPPLPPDLKEIRAMQGEEAAAEPPPAAADGQAAPAAAARKRRRRRRRGKGGAASEAAPAETAVTGSEEPGAPEPTGEEIEQAEEAGPDLEPATEEEGSAAALADAEDPSWIDAGAQEAEKAGAEADARTAEAAEAVRKRRRRRRRRRPKGNGAPAPTGAQEESPSSSPRSHDDPAKGTPTADEEIVPRGVRAEELLPAATGGRRKVESGRGGRPHRRHRRGGTHRGSWPGRGGPGAPRGPEGLGD